MDLRYEPGQILKYKKSNEGWEFGLCIKGRISTVSVFSERGCDEHISAKSYDIRPVASLEEVPELTMGTFTKANRQEFIANAKGWQSRIIAGLSPIEV